MVIEGGKKAGAGCGCALCRQPMLGGETQPTSPHNTWLFANLQRAYESVRKRWREQNNIPLGGWRQ